MLVLSRRKNESILIGNEIRLIVIEVSGGRVRLGIVAPPHVAVHREELVSRIAHRLSAPHGYAELTAQASADEPAAERRPAVPVEISCAT